MNTKRVVTSAALYFQTGNWTVVPLDWLEVACHFFEESDLPVTYFDTRCVDFPGEDVQDFTSGKERLIESLQRGSVGDLSLGSIRAGGDDVEDWQIRVSIGRDSGILYVGADVEVVSHPVALLHRAYAIARVGLDVRYGIAYSSRLAEAPELYAAGARSYSLQDIAGERVTRVKRTRLDAWFEEYVGERRYLSGLFRGAYPASVLSEAHVRRANLRSLGLGSLSELNAGLWVWELSDVEISTADRALDEVGVLIK